MPSWLAWRRASPADWDAWPGRPPGAPGAGRSCPRRSGAGDPPGSRPGAEIATTDDVLALSGSSTHHILPRRSWRTVTTPLPRLPASTFIGRLSQDSEFSWYAVSIIPAERIAGEDAVPPGGIGLGGRDTGR